MNKTNKGELIDLGSIAIIFLAAVLIGGPQGNFPLNDDWSFALTTQRLVSDHLWRPTGWTSMPLVTHAVWGAVFCEAAGHCTSQTLRAANIAAAVVALISTYLLGREAGLSRTHRLMLVALFGANPIFFALSFTFMTDITFVALAMLAALFFVKALRTDAAAAVIGATGLSILAVLCRQVALFLPLAFAVAWLWRGPRTRRNLILAIVPIIVTLGSMIAFNTWMRLESITPAFYSAVNGRLTSHLFNISALIKGISINFITLILYVGLFCAPMLNWKLNLWTPASLRARRTAAAASLLFGATALGFCLWKGPMPVGGNILTSSGIGPYVLPPYPSHLDAAADRPLVAALWWLATAVAIAGGALFVRRLVLAGEGLVVSAREPTRRVDTSIVVFFLASALIYIGPLLVAGFYDRYLLPLLLVVPLVGAPFLQPAPRRIALTATSLAVASLAVLSVVWVHDYMTWNRARWTAISKLTDSGTPVSQINGGFELFGQTCFGKTPECPMDEFMSWEKRNPEYSLAFAPIPGHRIVEAVDFDAWMPLSERQILILKKIAP